MGKVRVGRKIVTSTPEPVKERAKTKKDERIKRLITCCWSVQIVNLDAVLGSRHVSLYVVTFFC